MKSELGTIRVAVVNWKLRFASSDGKFYGHMHDLISKAHDEGADMVVLPENHSLELLSLAPDLEERHVPEFMAQFALELENWIGRISRISGLIIVGGSHIKHSSEGYKNVCPVAHPLFGLRMIEKNNLTTYEREMWHLTPGAGITAMQEKWLGVLICYDSEFPEAGRVLAENGALIHAIPAFTETVQGFQRVRWSARARAIENQVYAVHASLVGSLEREPVPQTYGSSAILTPSTEPFPEEAVLVESKYNVEEVIVADVDLDLLMESRENGDVRNWNDRRATGWTWNESTESLDEGSDPQG